MAHCSAITVRQPYLVAGSVPFFAFTLGHR
jgi:hypothetical protein